MLEKRKNLFMLIFGVTLFAIGFIFYIWTAGRSPEIVKEFNFPSNSTVDVGRNNVYSPTNIFGHSNMQTMNSPFSAAQNSSSEAENGYVDSFGAVAESFKKTVEDSFKSAPVTRTLPRPSSSPASSPEIVITAKELFEFAYPQDYLNVLASFKNDLATAGFISANESYPMTSMDEVIQFQDKFSDYLESFPDLSKDDIASYRKAYKEVLPQLWRSELMARKAAQQTSFFPLKWWYKYNQTMTAKKINGVLAFIRERNFPSAYAQAACFFPGPPNFIQGSQRAAPCCNCYAGFVPIGCLNRVCVGMPAIFDQTTGICGCWI